jgi:glycosyltransferase involved in cell wall biosynthesis
MKNNETLDICVITYNRLEYLKNCVWSILAATRINYRLFVIDDGSNDGTIEWLSQMKQNKKIDDYFVNTPNVGTPETCNRAMKETTSSVVAIISDDIWVHRGWDIESLNVYNKYSDCGMVSFWNFPIDRFKNRSTTKPDATTYRHQSIGVAALLLDRDLFNVVGGYELPNDLKMGYFSRIFCSKAANSSNKRKNQYLLDPYYAEQMDRRNPGEGHLPEPKLNQEYLYREYNKRRNEYKRKHKNGK